MITPAYAPTATERVLPRMALDFTTGVLDPRVTVTRALNTATRVNSSGVIEGVNANLPRFDYDPVTLAPKGLLIEEARTNILLNSADFGAASWTTLRGVLTTDVVNAPDGTLSADKFTEGATTNTRATQPAAAVSVVNGAAYSLSVFLKNGDRRFVSLIVVNNSTGANGFLATFDLQEGTYTTQNRGASVIASASMTPFGNGWYRCSITGNAPENFILAYISPATTATPTQGSFGRESYTGDGAKFFYLWGAQFEAGAFLTSYIPTTATSLTRNADVVKMTGANFSDWWQTGRGSALVRARPSTVSGTRPWVQFDDATADNIIALRGNTTNPELYIRAGGADQVQIDAGTIDANTGYRLAGAWATDDCAVSLNGGAVVTAASATIPAVTQARIGSDGTNYLNGHIQAIEYYDERVLNASLQVLSSQAGRRSIIGPVFRGSIIS